MNWVILTGEYPPDPGGVSDHTKLVADELVKLGDQVQVWFPKSAQMHEPASNVQLFPTRGHFGPRALFAYTRKLFGLKNTHYFFIQYVPHAYGYKALNILFALWLHILPKSRVVILFHEVAFPLRPKQPLKYNLLAYGNRMMAKLAAAAASHIQVTTPSWIPLLRSLGVTNLCTWNPVPSNIGRSQCSTTLAHKPKEIRTEWTGNLDTAVIGHFGTYSAPIASRLEPTIQLCLSRNNCCIFVLLGYGSTRFAQDFIRDHPETSGRVFGIGEKTPEDLRLYIQACDLFIQPYPDGVTSRRTTMMALLSLGKPVVTNAGHLTEDFWLRDEVSIIEPNSDPANLVSAAEKLMTDLPARHELGSKASSYYESHFAAKHAARRIREAFQSAA